MMRGTGTCNGGNGRNGTLRGEGGTVVTDVTVTRQGTHTRLTALGVGRSIRGVLLRTCVRACARCV